MKFDKTIMLACVLALFGAFAAFGCGDDDAAVTDAGTDSGTDTDTDTDADADIVATATLTVPDDFAATPDRIQPVFYSSYPPVGMPIGVGTAIPAPAIGPGVPFELSTNAVTLADQTVALGAGDYYLSVVLYVEGGGTMLPIPGVDWAGSSDTMITIPVDAPVDVGDIELALYEDVIGDAGVDGGN